MCRVSVNLTFPNRAFGAPRPIKFGPFRHVVGLTEQDPNKQYKQPMFEKQPQSAPGLAQDMDPKPDRGKTSYQSFGRLAGRRAVITGADSGIGRAVTIAFARERTDIALNDLTSEEKDAQQVGASTRRMAARL